MKTEDLKTMIDLYFDGELEKGKEPILFTSLSQDEEARDYFKKMNALTNEIGNSLDGFPEDLDTKIMRKVGQINDRQMSAFINKKVFSVIAYSATIILLILTIFFYSRAEEYRVQFVDLTREVKKQNDRLELIMNAMPQVEVTGGYLKTKQIIVRPNM